MTNLSQTALGAWSGGRYMRFGAPLDDDRFEALLRPDKQIQTVITADTYGTGEADKAVGRALAGLPRDSYNLVGAVGHDFVNGERVGAKGFPRFTNPDLRGPDQYADYLRGATEASLERCGVDSFDLLLLHNPDRIGYTSPVVWEAMAALKAEGLADAIGVAPGPANGFVLDLINCVETFGELIDWAMVILNPLEPWPATLSLGACEANNIKVIARVADYGGLFHGDVKAGHPFLEFDHRNYRPAGWVEAGLAKIEQMRPYADEAGLTTLQLACAWNLSHPAIECVVPTLIEEGVEGCRPVEEQRKDLAGLPANAGSILTAEAVEAIREIGDNKGSMRLKGAGPNHEGDEAADSWALSEELVVTGSRWDVAPTDLTFTRA
jgi:aryl-alcohol dehydrogenase-like predicted oxidoreductase